MSSTVPAGITRGEITMQLRALGLHAGMGLMVHSSLSRLGWVEGGAEAVIGALQDVLTPAGTLLMPSFNHGAPFEPGGAGIYDPKSTPTTNGRIPDTFWRQDGVLRTLNPTHAIAGWGARAGELLADHHRTSTFGARSPYARLHGMGGWCLLLGVGYRANTFHHVVEMLTRAPCLGYETELYPVRLPDGRLTMHYTWGWRAAPCPIDDTAAYAPLMRETGQERRGMVGQAEAILYPLSAGYQVISRCLADGLDDTPPCRRCPIRPRTHLWGHTPQP
ncbi:MAG: AAC(3) family N-acetyltransferase [Chloroflexi bacterium]|nr:AAC(3) family N-acetyltransferase [Chloroflexota bacterium]